MCRDMMVRRSLTCLIFLTCLPALAGARENLTVEKIFASPEFRTKALREIQWLEGGKVSFFETDPANGQRDLYVASLATGKKELVLDADSLSSGQGGGPMHIASYQWSRDGKQILLTGALPARRIKSGGNFGVYTVATRSFRMLAHDSTSQAIIKFSPDGSKIGFVRSNNLFVMDSRTGAETQLTFDGSDNIINGKFDWVYEEEFSIIDGWDWSPDSRRIAFWRLDQSPEPEFPILWYSKDHPGASVEMTRYPQAGERNAQVKIGVIDLATKKTDWIDLGGGGDFYVPRIDWTPDPLTLCVEKLNRAQDTLDVLLADLRNNTVRRLLRETDTAWIDVHDDLTFLRKSAQFLWTSNRDGDNHIYLYRLDGSLVRQVTHGDWEVTKIVGTDERKGRIFFLATAASPLEEQLYTIGFDGKGMERVTPQHGVHDVNVSPDGDAYIDTYSSLDGPPVVTLCRGDGKPIAPLVENRLETLQKYSLGNAKFFTFTTGDGALLNGWMITPPGFDPSRKYPVLVYVYGGPSSQTVRDEWGGPRYLWFQMLAEKGYIIASVDNRGTGGRGKEFLQQVHRMLGIREVQDQIEAAKYLSGLPYVDSTRIGIWVWSGGGFMTCLAMTLGADYFKTGVAVAPVTSWRFYDTIYTERYMDTPEKNPEGYRLTSPITYADKLKGNLLIIHGTADDNVHWQNTIVFVNELIHLNKQVHTMFYPGRDHGIRGDNATPHLFTLITEFILQNL